ncbi:MAG: sigma-70 family RNA polymerase sigma factor [Bacteroidales bacterium]|nr:MAG: sigma-70 family RNA polymerase sigma factor [Bacteroidales bacterium]
MDINEIIRSCLIRDKAAFRMLVDRYSDFAFSVAFRILNDEDESHDIVQESFITVWNKIEAFNPENNFSNWFYRIIVNKCIDALRKKKRNPMVYPDANSWSIPGLYSESNPDTKLNNKEIGKLIRSLTNQLSRKQKIVFVLSELEGLSRDDIAEITGMTRTSIKSNLFHARKKIGKLIEKYI